jgi:aryl-alcohol dehydrogenase-like predicted oxidoreductase
MPITRLSFGTEELGGAKATAGRADALTERHATSMLHAAYELGIMAFDTAPEYGNAEQRVGAFLTEFDLHEEIAVSTRLPSLAQVETSRIEQHVEDSLTASLRRLRSDVIDVYFVCSADDLRRHGDVLVDALRHQRDKGRVLTIGLAADSPEELELLEEHPELAVAQHPCNLLDRRLVTAAWPERLAASGTQLQVRRPLSGGLLASMAGSGVDEERAADLRRLSELLERYDLTPASAALPFVLSFDPASVVVEAGTIEQLEGIVASATTDLPPELVSEIDGGES